MTYIPKFPAKTHIELEVDMFGHSNKQINVLKWGWTIYQLLYRYRLLYQYYFLQLRHRCAPFTMALNSLKYDWNHFKQENTIQHVQHTSLSFKLH